MWRRASRRLANVRAGAQQVEPRALFLLGAATGALFAFALLAGVVFDGGTIAFDLLLLLFREPWSSNVIHLASRRPPDCSYAAGARGAAGSERLSFALGYPS